MATLTDVIGALRNIADTVAHYPSHAARVVPDALRSIADALALGEVDGTNHLTVKSTSCAREAYMATQTDKAQDWRTEVLGATYAIRAILTDKTPPFEVWVLGQVTGLLAAMRDEIERLCDLDAEHEHR